MRRWFWSVAAGLLLCGVAEAHHFKGLPHFNYFENYPQVPQEEFLGQAGSFELSLVIYDFQGIDGDDAERPDDVRFYLIAYDLRAARVYNGPALLEIMDRDEVVYAEHMASSKEESIYAVQAQLSDTGRYRMRVTLEEADGLVVDIPFVLSSQKIHWGKWLGGGLLLLIIVAAVGARRARVLQDRVSRAQATQKDSR